ncbi:hypothetical protein C1645_782251 [Glomus cerebriforme]|uniref:Uncharacterized protein n=1 Tax=Glomus cerebriforme TaxID=658196 RepID=A0A397SK63_9GLOM|nr:hypothetical protein C1645_782251 [Glomus cerebriforme]
MEENIELFQIEQATPKQQQNWYLEVTIFVLSILYLYLAIKEYPKWRKFRENFFTKSKKTKSDFRPEMTEQKNLLLYIPFIPFAAVYLTLRITWDTFKLFVFYSLDLIETGFIMFWHLLIQNIKIIPKFFAAMPSFWKTYIQNPFLKVLHHWIDWMYLYAWPVLKSTMIIMWDISGIVWTEGRKAAIYSWNFLEKYSKIGWDEIIFPLLSWVIIELIFEPGKWIISRGIYLGRISWYCACFLARDLAEDLKDLFCFGWKLSGIIYNTVLQPAGILIVEIYEIIRNYFPIFQKILYTRFILAIRNEAIYVIYEICRDPLFRSCVEYIYSILRSEMLYNFVKKLVNDIHRNLQIIKPKLMNRMRQCGLELVEFTFTSALEIARSTYTYYTILLPILINIPVIYNEFKQICNEFYRNIKERVSKILESLWIVFAPLLRPVILALSFFYTTVILVTILSAFRMAKWVGSISIIALNKALALLQKGLSTLNSMLRSMYNILLPYISLILQTTKDMIYELYITINDLVAENFPTFMNNLTRFVSRQVQIFKEYVMNVYEKYGPVIMELKDRAKATADEAVLSIGQSMLEWVKKEKALKEGASFKEE